MHNQYRHPSIKGLGHATQALVRFRPDTDWLALLHHCRHGDALAWFRSEVNSERGVHAPRCVVRPVSDASDLQRLAKAVGEVQVTSPAPTKDIQIPFNRAPPAGKAVE